MSGEAGAIQPAASGPPGASLPAPSEAPAPPFSDWAALPADLLSAVFSLVLAPPSGLPAWPLRLLLPQLLALRRTCRHWAEVARSVPLAAEIHAASPPCPAWLASCTLRTLRLASSAQQAIDEEAEARLLASGASQQGWACVHELSAAMEAAGWQQEVGGHGAGAGASSSSSGAGEARTPCAECAVERVREELEKRERGVLQLLQAQAGLRRGLRLEGRQEEQEEGQHEDQQQPTLRGFREARSVGWSAGAAQGADEAFPWVAAAAGHTLSFDSMLQELEGVRDVSTMQAPRPKTWTLSAWPLLEVVHLEGPVNWHGDFALFDADGALSGLTRLREVSLFSFYGFDLSGLPPSLRRLRLHFEPCLSPEWAKRGRGVSFNLLELPEHARLDELVLVKSTGWLAFDWHAVSRRCRRLVAYTGACQKGFLTPIVGVRLPGEADPDGRLAKAFYSEVAALPAAVLVAAREAATAAWLADFTSGACLLEELCFGVEKHSEAGGKPPFTAYLLPVEAPLRPEDSGVHGSNRSSGSGAGPSTAASDGPSAPGAAGQQLRRYHDLTMQAFADNVQDVSALDQIAPAVLPADSSKELQRSTIAKAAHVWRLVSLRPAAAAAGQA